MQVSTKELYAEMDSVNPNWRQAYGSFDEALAKAGDRAAALHKSWARELEEKTKVALQGKRRVKEEDVPVFDRGGCGRAVLTEREDEPGNEVTTLGDVDEEGALNRSPLHRAAEGMNEDSLFHPERSVRWTDKPYHWNPVAPRSHGAIRCY